MRRAPDHSVGLLIRQKFGLVIIVKIVGVDQLLDHSYGIVRNGCKLVRHPWRREKTQLPEKNQGKQQPNLDGPEKILHFRKPEGRR